MHTIALLPIYCAASVLACAAALLFSTLLQKAIQLGGLAGYTALLAVQKLHDHVPVVGLEQMTLYLW